MIAEVVVDLALDRSFDYLVPPELAGSVGAGSRVRVPFGRGERAGFVLALKDAPAFPGRLKALLGLDRNSPRLPANLIRLAEWMAEYYCCAAEHAVRALLPAAVIGGFPGGDGVVVEIVQAELDALVADIDARAGDQPPHLLLRQGSF